MLSNDCLYIKYYLINIYSMFNKNTHKIKYNKMYQIHLNYKDILNYSI